MKYLMKLGIPKYYAHMAANSSEGYWFISATGTVNRALSKEILERMGFYDLADAYRQMHVNYWNSRINEPYVRLCERVVGELISYLLLDYNFLWVYNVIWGMVLKPISQIGAKWKQRLMVSRSWEDINLCFLDGVKNYFISLT